MAQQRPGIPEPLNASRLIAVGFGLAATTAACFGSGMGASTKFSNGENPRTDHALATASKDFGCPLADLRVLAETQRRYVNETGLRFVIQGCGIRGTYLEQCTLADAPPPGFVQVNGSIACGYLIVAKMPVAKDAGPAAASPPASQDSNQGPDAGLVSDAGAPGYL